MADMFSLLPQSCGPQGEVASFIHMKACGRATPLLEEACFTAVACPMRGKKTRMDHRFVTLKNSRRASSFVFFVLPSHSSPTCSASRQAESPGLTWTRTTPVKDTDLPVCKGSTRELYVEMIRVHSQTCEQTGENLLSVKLHCCGALLGGS